MEKCLPSLTTVCTCGEKRYLEEFILFIIPIQEDTNFPVSEVVFQDFRFPFTSITCHPLSDLQPEVSCVSDWIWGLLISSQNIYPKFAISETLV